jgi:hypothetical protein
MGAQKVYRGGDDQGVGQRNLADKKGDVVFDRACPCIDAMITTVARPDVEGWQTYELESVIGRDVSGYLFHEKLAVPQLSLRAYEAENREPGLIGFVGIHAVLLLLCNRYTIECKRVL